MPLGLLITLIHQVAAALIRVEKATAWLSPICNRIWAYRRSGAHRRSGERKPSLEAPLHKGARNTVAGGAEVVAERPQVEPQKSGIARS